MMSVRRLVLLCGLPAVMVLAATPGFAARTVQPVTLALSPTLAPDTTTGVIAPAALPGLTPVLHSDGPTARTADRAPMPDADVDAPTSPTDGAPAVSPTLYSTRTQYRGDGMVYGSSPQLVQERSQKPAAGVALNVPLD